MLSFTFRNLQFPTGPDPR